MPGTFELRQDMIEAAKKKTAAETRLNALLRKIGVDKVKLKGDTETILPIPCLTDADCPDDKPECDKGKCTVPKIQKVKCRSDADCPMDMPQCIKGTCEEAEQPEKPSLPPGWQQANGPYSSEEEARAAAKEALKEERKGGISIPGDLL